MWKLIIVSSASLCYHIVYNTKFASTIQKPVQHKVDPLACGRNCVTHNDIYSEHGSEPGDVNKVADWNGVNKWPKPYS